MVKTTLLSSGVIFNTMIILVTLYSFTHRNNLTIVIFIWSISKKWSLRSNIYIFHQEVMSEVGQQPGNGWWLTYVLPINKFQSLPACRHRSARRRLEDERWASMPRRRFLHRPEMAIQLAWRMGALFQDPQIWPNIWVDRKRLADGCPVTTRDLHPSSAQLFLPASQSCQLLPHFTSKERYYTGMEESPLIATELSSHYWTKLILIGSNWPVKKVSNLI